ncbi:hypothetical protein ILUMI_20603 [Ignelater luminosus]|uniref:Uncharacterized protein n=1 Tax=Ignelater luminosus TaxID=2038154 RepID=A0A8K0FYS0_IGNLU|nr:hypothetical protein ILUMI_20603 [Ignelater luminosus]
MTRFLQKGYSLAAGGSAILIVASPIFNSTSKKPILLPFFVDVEKRGFLVYGLAWLIESGSVLLTGLIIGGLDGLIFFFIAIAGAELRILREKIIEAVQSAKIGDACYMSEWINCGPSVRKSLFIIMERAKRPLELTAGGFVSLSLDTLVSVS